MLMKDKKMKISVALCTYNGEKFLSYQIDSILEQTISIDEIIVCDDGSTDSTIKILNSYKEKYPALFKIHINKKNLRSVKNFEKAISLCENDLIFLSDQDDIWVHNKVELILRVFENDENISVICTNGFGIDEQGKLLDVVCTWDTIEIVRQKDFIFDYYNILNLVDNFCTGATMAIRKNIKKDIFPFPIKDGLHHDKWISLVATLKNKFYFLNEKLIYYRSHPSQQVGNVFYDKKDKDLIVNYFSIERQKKSFSDYKRLLKKFYIAYKKSSLLKKELPEQNIFFENNLNEIKKRFHDCKKEMNKKYPIKSKILAITDYILNKRQMNSL